MEVRVYEIRIVCGVRESAEPEEKMFLVSPGKVIFLGTKSTKEKPDSLPPFDEIQKIAENCRPIQEMLIEIQREVERKLSTFKTPQPLQLSLFD